jgi:hypothetical protein
MAPDPWQKAQLREAALERARNRARATRSLSAQTQTAAPAGQVSFQPLLEKNGVSEHFGGRPGADNVWGMGTLPGRSGQADNLWGMGLPPIGGGRQDSHILLRDAVPPAEVMRDDYARDYSSDRPLPSQALPYKARGYGKWEPPALPSSAYPSTAFRSDSHFPVSALLAGELLPAADIEADGFSIKPFSPAESHSRSALLDM